MMLLTSKRRITWVTISLLVTAINYTVQHSTSNIKFLYFSKIRLWTLAWRKSYLHFWNKKKIFLVCYLNTTINNYVAMGTISKLPKIWRLTSKNGEFLFLLMSVSLEKKMKRKKLVLSNKKKVVYDVQYYCLILYYLYIFLVKRLKLYWCF